MQQSLSNSNPSDSMIDEKLADYSKAQLLPFQQSSSSASFSFNSMFKKINPFEKTVLEGTFNKLEKLKINFYKERNTLIQNFNLQNLNHQVINTLMSDQNQSNKRNQQNKMLKLTQEQTQKIQQQLQEAKIQQKKILREKSVYQEVTKFGHQLKELFKESKINFQSQEQINQKAIKVLKQNLNKKSELTLHKLKPYLQQSLQNKKQNNQILKDNNKFLVKQKLKHNQENKLSMKITSQERQKNKNNELEDQIEDQKIIQQQIKHYQKQFKQDIEIQRKKAIIQ